MGERLSEQAFNALTELGNIGAGNATTSLSVMLNSKLTMSPPKVDIYDFNALENILGGPDATVMGVLSTIGGDMNAMILFVVKALMGDGVEWHSEIGISAIGEIANIIIGSYVASLETLTGMKMRYSQPESCIDMAGAILSVPCIEFGKISDKALLINSQFKAGEKAVDGYIMMMSEMHSFDALLNRLGIGGIDG